MSISSTTPLAVGARLFSAVCSTSVIVTRAPKHAVELTCGGQPMLKTAPPEPSGTPDPELADGTLVGKRYTHQPTRLELVCTKAGDGTIAVNREPLSVQGPKALPSSD